MKSVLIFSFTFVFLQNSLGQSRTIAFGDYHHLRIKNGKVFSSGRNNRGQLGDGSYEEKFQEIEATGLFDVLEVAAGADFSLALTTDGTVYAWGNNEVGQLGQGKVLKKSPVPLKIKGVENVRLIAAGRYHAAALTKDGKVYVWGQNLFGQSGEGRLVQWTPSHITALTNIKTIMLGAFCSFALDNKDKLYAWGRNTTGTLGDGGFENRSVPVKINLIGVKSVSASPLCSWAVMNDGSVFYWGDIREISDSKTIVPIPVRWEGVNDVEEIRAAYHTLIRNNKGEVFGLGGNEYGQLGKNEKSFVCRPIHLPLSFPVKEAAVGNGTIGVVTGDGAFICWGLNRNGQLGYDSDENTPYELFKPEANEIPERHPIMVEIVED